MIWASTRKMTILKNDKLSSRWKDENIFYIKYKKDVNTFFQISEDVMLRNKLPHLLNNNGITVQILHLFTKYTRQVLGTMQDRVMLKDQ